MRLYFVHLEFRYSIFLTSISKFSDFTLFFLFIVGLVIVIRIVQIWHFFAYQNPSSSLLVFCYLLQFLEQYCWCSLKITVMFDMSSIINISFLLNLDHPISLSSHHIFFKFNSIFHSTFKFVKLGFSLY